jgi:hypothetical protein
VPFKVVVLGVADPERSNRPRGSGGQALRKSSVANGTHSLGSGRQDRSRPDYGSPRTGRNKPRIFANCISSKKYPDKLGLVEEFIVEIEGPPQKCDLTRWDQFTDIKAIKKEMFDRLERKFESWLNP